MFIHNKLRMLLKNTIKFKSDYELRECLILATDKGHYLSQISCRYLEYYNRCKRLTEVEKKYHELLAEVSTRKPYKRLK